MVEQVARILAILLPGFWIGLHDPLATPQQPVADEFKYTVELDAFLKAPTTTTTTATTLPPTTTTTVKPRPKPNRTTANHEILDCIATYEGGYTSVNPTGKYRGRYQFDDSTWLSNGGDAEYVGRMQEAPPDMQDQVALTLLSRRGLQPWPTPSVKCAHLL